MAKSIKEVMAGLPKERQEKIKRGAEAMAAEMIAEFDSLEALRKAHGKTQHQLAENLGIGQNAVSQIERRTDLYVSTLRKYVSALGAELEISLKTKDGARIILRDLHPWQKGSTVNKRNAPRRASRPGQAQRAPARSQKSKAERRASS